MIVLLENAARNSATPDEPDMRFLYCDDKLDNHE
jgi:hypothetical protein